MWSEILTALALVLIIEGLLPFVSPSRYREAIRTMLGNSDRTMRFVGLSSMIIGVVMLTIVR